MNILKNIYKKIRLDLLFGLCFALLVFILNSDLITLYIKLPIVGGFDAFNHLVVAQYYAENIFPKTWGWVPLWYGGMPFPQFYPPLFYFLLALLSKILPFSFVTIFKTVTLSLYLIVPALVSGFARRLISKEAGIISGLISVLFITDYGVRSFWGASSYAMFNSGLETQFLGFAFLLPWLYFMVTAEKNKHAIYIAQVLLFFLFLSNAHVVPVAGALFFALMLVRANRHNALKYFLSGFVPLLAASFWYIPMLAQYKYLVSIAITPSQQELTVFLIFPGVFLLCTLYLALKRKESDMLIIPATFLMILPVLFLSSVISSLPVHPARMIELVYSLVPIPLAYLAVRLFSHLPSRTFKLIAYVLIFMPLIGLVWISSFSKSYDGFYTNEEQDNLPDIVASLKNAKGLVHVERHSHIGYRAYALNAVLGQNGIKTNYINFRESAVSSIFRIPLLNSLSRASETWGVKSFLVEDQLFLKQPLTAALERARFMNVDHFLMQSYQMVNSMRKSKEVNFDKNLGTWKLFSLKEEGEEAEIPDTQLTLLFSHVTFKNRKLADYDYAHIQEELLFSRAYNHVLFVQANDTLLDRTKDLFKFNSAMISEYHYRSEDKAYARLKEYALTHHLVLVSDNDPLFKRLAALSLPTIHIIEKKSTETSVDYNPVRNELQRLFVLMKTWEPEKRAYAPQKITTRFNPDSECLALSMGSESSTLMPVLLKDSYFPAWKNMNGQDVYMASPTFMLTFIKNKEEKLCFKTPYSLYAGVVASLGAFTGFGYLVYKRPRFMKSKNS